MTWLWARNASVTVAARGGWTCHCEVGAIGKTESWARSHGRREGEHVSLVCTVCCRTYSTLCVCSPQRIQGHTARDYALPQIGAKPRTPVLMEEAAGCPDRWTSEIALALDETDLPLLSLHHRGCTWMDGWMHMCRLAIRRTSLRWDGDVPVQLPCAGRWSV